MNITGQGAYDTNTYNNLFHKFGYEEQEINARLEASWNELFYGEENTRIYYPMGEDKGYLLDTGNNDVRSEGMSYGMMMAVQMDKKKNSIGSGIIPIRSCSMLKVDTRIILPGTANPMEPAYLKVLHLMVRSFSQWLCSSLLTAGVMEMPLITIRNKPEEFSVHAFIKGKWRGRSHVGPGNQADQICTGITIQ